MAFVVVTVAISGAIADGVVDTSFPALPESCVCGCATGKVVDFPADDVAVVSVTAVLVEAFKAVESVAPADFATGVGFETGNRICESAITISERNRARKKRLSI